MAVEFYVQLRKRDYRIPGERDNTKMEALIYSIKLNKKPKAAYVGEIMAEIAGIFAIMKALNIGVKEAFEKNQRRNKRDTGALSRESTNNSPEKEESPKEKSPEKIGSPKEEPLLDELNSEFMEELTRTLENERAKVLIRYNKHGIY